MSLERFGVALEGSTLAAFDRWRRKRGYPNRSAALRELVRRALLEAAREEAAGDLVGTITMVYDHARREISDRLTKLGHRHGSHIVSTLHVHLDRRRCLEVLIVHGLAGALAALQRELAGTKGGESVHLAVAARGGRSKGDAHHHG